MKIKNILFALAWFSASSVTGHAYAEPSLVAYHNPPPGYPKLLLGQQLEGRVEYRVTVQPDGRVSEVKIINATHAGFASAVEQTVSRWLFYPDASVAEAEVISGSAFIEFRIQKP